jgi:hypothetical protein
MLIIRRVEQDGKTKSVWEGGEIVEAVAFDVPGIFFGGKTKLTF